MKTTFKLFYVELLKLLPNTMKFVLKQNGPARSRLGKIEMELKDERKIELKTPMCFVYTESGSVPHITYDVLEKLTSDKLPMQMPLPNVIDFEESIKNYGKGIGPFVGGTSDNLIYIPVQDPAKETQSGFNVKKGISIWNYGGRIPVNIDRFMKLQESYQPHIYQCLTDSDTSKESSNKRVSHSVSRSIEMLDQCLKIHNESKILKNSAIFGSIQGGYQRDARKYSATETALRPVDGFVIEGFHNNGPEVTSMQFEDIKELLEDVISYLPENKPRIMHGPFDPKFILKCVMAGIDMFDSSYPYLVTERGCALVFKLQAKSQLILSETKEIRLEDEKFKEDFSPILEGCECYTCKRFTKAYINHLLITLEMLGSTLLMLHNLHHYLEFFKDIQNALQIVKE